MEFRNGNGPFEFLLCRLHQRRVERAAHGQHQSALGAGFLQSLASHVNGLCLAGNNQLSGTVVVGRYDYQTGFLTDGCADCFHLVVSQGDDGSHRAGLCFTSPLHGNGTGGYKAQTIFKTQTARSRQGGQLAQGVTGHHVGLEISSHTKCADHTVQEHGRLRDLGLLQLLVCSAEHDVGNAETENVIGFFKKLLGNGMLFIQVLAHAYELRALSGKNKCLHIIIVFLLMLIRMKRTDRLSL